MKKTAILIVCIVVLLVSSIAISKETESKTDPKKEYLKKVLFNLEQIKSATYYITDAASARGDTTRISKPRTRFIKMFMNPSDTLVGSKSAIYVEGDTTRIKDFYDGFVRGTFNWEKQSIMIDSFQNHPYPFRLVHYPFYTKILEIIKYSLNTKDSIKTNLQDFGDSIRFSLRIYDKHVYFHIKPIVIKNDHIPEDEISYFDIWFRKGEYLPYRMRSRWHHSTYFEECSNVKFNTTHEAKFISTDHFPKEFKLTQYKRKKRKSAKNTLEGKLAPNWDLKDLSNNAVSLKDLKSKVLLLQFTGVGCGPCHSSLPFLKQLVEDNKEKDFELISIETWADNIEGLKRYRDRNEINYKFLNANESIKKAYNINAVPIFFILDENRIIRKVIQGYGKGSTDKKIIDAINELL